MQEEHRILRIGFPSGSLQGSTLRLFARAGYQVQLTPRSYEPDIDDPELEGLMFRAQEIAQYVEREIIDVGLTGKDGGLITARKLTLDDDIRTYLPEFPDYGTTITLRHMIHHTSGIRDYMDLMELAGLRWENSYHRLEIVDLVSTSSSSEAKSKPSERWHTISLTVILPH